MQYKDILVHLENSPNCETRINLAISVAQKHQAKLTGLYVITHQHYTPHPNNIERGSETAVYEFKQKASLAGVSVEALCIDTKISGIDMTAIINEHSHFMDLVIAGQSDPDVSTEKIPHDLPERLVLGSGCPVLIIPFTGMYSSIGNCVTVAWKSGRESARAIKDAMPFLETAGQVNILEVVAYEAGKPANMINCNRIGRHLSNYGIAVKVDQLIAGNIPVGDVILNQAWEIGGDLLVMGAYSNVHRGKAVLGPVAKHILKHMTMPVLMSH